MRRQTENALGIIVLIVMIALVVIDLCIVLQRPVSNSQYKVPERFHGIEAPVNADVFFDADTGVYYAIFWNDIGISVTELYNLDGLPVAVDDANHAFLDQALESVHSNLQEYESTHPNSMGG